MTPIFMREQYTAQIREEKCANSARKMPRQETAPPDVRSYQRRDDLLPASLSYFWPASVLSNTDQSRETLSVESASKPTSRLLSMPGLHSGASIWYSIRLLRSRSSRRSWTEQREEMDDVEVEGSIQTRLRLFLPELRQREIANLRPLVACRCG